MSDAGPRLILALAALALCDPAWQTARAQDDPAAALPEGPAQDPETTPEPKTYSVIKLPDPAAAAVPPQAEASPAIEEIIVTAQKREENLQDVPISMAAFSERDIQERQITSISDIAAQTAGFEFGDVAGTSQVSIRGVGLSLVSGAGENSVAIHTDGVYIPQPAAANLMYDELGGVEVLRGPQGTLYGRNATGGVLNLISVAPPEDLEIGAGLQYGNLGQRKFKLHAGSGFLDDQLRVRGAAILDELRDDYFENVEYPERGQGARELHAARVAADLTPVESFDVKLRAFRAQEQANGPHYEAYKPSPNAILAPPGTFTDDPYTHRNNNAGVFEKDLDVASLKAGWSMSDAWSLSALTGYSQFRYFSEHYDGDGTSNDLITVEFRDNRDETVTEELLFSFTGDALRWTTGLYYMDQRFEPSIHSLVDVVALASIGADVLGSVTSPAVADLLNRILQQLPLGSAAQLDIFFDSSESTESLAAFTDLTWELLDGFETFAGLRYTSEKKDQRLTIQIFEPTTGQGQTQCQDARTRLDYEAVTGRAGAQFHWNERSMVYGQLSRGFKAGGFAISACNSTFEPEELDSVEFGIKSTWLDSRLRSNGSVYFYDYRNLQVEEINLPNAFINNAQAEVSGAELELLFLPAEGWELSSNVAYMDAVYTEFANADVETSPLAATPLAQDEDLSGNRLNRTPEWAVDGAIQYSLDLGRIGALTLRGDASYKSDYFLREFNNATDKQEAHTIYNAFINYTSPDDAFAVRGFVKNITDEPVLAGLVGILGYKNAAFNPPRMYGMSVEYRFMR